VDSSEEEPIRQKTTRLLKIVLGQCWDPNDTDASTTAVLGGALVDCFFDLRFKKDGVVGSVRGAWEAGLVIEKILDSERKLPVHGTDVALPSVDHALAVFWKLKAKVAWHAQARRRTRPDLRCDLAQTSSPTGGKCSLYTSL